MEATLKPKAKTRDEQYRDAVELIYELDKNGIFLLLKDCICDMRAERKRNGITILVLTLIIGILMYVSANLYLANNLTKDELTKLFKITTGTEFIKQ